MILVILLPIMLILTSCVKNIDAVYESTKTKDKIVLARFPVRGSDKDNQRAIDSCKQFVKIQDSSCVFEESKTTCHSNPKTKSSSYCVIGGKKIE